METILDSKDCPHCGEKDAGVMTGIVREQIALGNMGEGIIGHVGARIYTVIDARRPPLTGARIPAIRVHTDLCKKCGRAFNFLIERGHGTLPVRPGDVPTFA